MALELMNIEKIELTNKELTKSIETLVKCVKMGNKNAWTVARTFDDIVKEEQWYDDFKNFEELASLLGVSKGYVSQCIKAVEILDANDLDGSLWTVGKCYALKGIELDIFKVWLSTTDYGEFNDLYQFSDKGLKNIVDEYKKAIEPETEDTTTKDTTTEDTTSEDTTSEVEDSVEFELNGIRYKMPISVLEQYAINE